MAAVLKSWIRLLCPKCERVQVFVLEEGWVLRCSGCGTEKRLEENGLLACV